MRIRSSPFWQIWIEQLHEIARVLDTMRPAPERSRLVEKTQEQLPLPESEMLAPFDPSEFPQPTHAHASPSSTTASRISSALSHPLRLQPDRDTDRSLSCFRDLETSILVAPSVEGLLSDVVLAANGPNVPGRLGGLQNPDDLFFRKTCSLHLAPSCFASKLTRRLDPLSGDWPGR